MWSDDCAYQRCGRGNWLEIRVPEGLFDAAEVPGTLLLPAVEIVPVPSCPLRKVPGASCPSASGIVPVPSRPCLSQIAQCACPKLPRASKVPGTSCLAAVGIVPVPSRPCLSQIAQCACPKLPRASKVPGTSCLAAVGIVPVPSCPEPRKCLAHRSSPRLELCLSQVGRTLSQIDPPNRRMCLSQIAQCACPKLPCACRCD